MPEYIYIVAERSPDINARFMDMRGAFKSESEAQKHREFVFEKYNIQTEVKKFILLDTVG